MIRIIFFVVAATLVILSAAASQETKKDPKKVLKKIPPFLEEVLKMTPEQFIKRFDKDGDGKVSMEEFPYVPKIFAASDMDGDGKLNRDEVARLLTVLRKVTAGGAPPAMDVEKVIDNLLKQFDANQDGKISRQEAKGRLLEVFDQFDTNKDGFLDRKELRVLAERMQAKGKGGPQPTGTPAYDFDALDKNADGRLSREELKGTPLYDRFDEIDTDRSGMIDRNEFEAFLKREAAKKAAK